jgi:hypothetical protein
LLMKIGQYRGARRSIVAAVGESIRTDVPS